AGAGDLGMEESHHFQTIFQAGFANPDEYPFSNGWLKNDHPLIEKKMFPSVRAVTINKVTDDALQQQQLMATFDPILESMEGAAFHYVCLMEKIPFIQIRAISNYVGDRNKANWKFKESIANLNNALIEIVRKYMVNS
ncbi:MAG: futalosine hydrolase, partial [Ferruginibacter sp.]